MNRIPVERFFFYLGVVGVIAALIGRFIHRKSQIENRKFR